MINLSAIAFPSAPKNTGEFVVYAYRDGKFSSCFVFAKAFAARKFCELVFDPLPTPKNNELSVDNIVLSSPEMKRIVAHKYSQEEREWRIPSPYPSHAYVIKHGAPPAHDQPDDDGPDTGEPRTARPKRTPRAEKPATHVTVQAIAEAIKMDPREARQILRKHSKKTEFGWAWPKNEADAVKKILQKYRKKK